MGVDFTLPVPQACLTSSSTMERYGRFLGGSQEHHLIRFTFLRQDFVITLNQRIIPHPVTESNHELLGNVHFVRMERPRLIEVGGQAGGSLHPLTLHSVRLWEPRVNELNLPGAAKMVHPAFLLGDRWALMVTHPYRKEGDVLREAHSSIPSKVEGAGILKQMATVHSVSWM